VVDLATELCQGRLVSVLEGGYRLDGLSDSVRRACEGFADLLTVVAYSVLKHSTGSTAVVRRAGK
jgi:acetoin utilization deacetylase AcuC-like enzyme